MSNAAGILVGVLCVFFWALHVIKCVAINWAAMLIIGIVIPPIGILHGAFIAFHFFVGR